MPASTVSSVAEQVFFWAAGLCVFMLFVAFFGRIYTIMKRKPNAEVRRPNRRPQPPKELNVEQLDKEFSQESGTLA